MLVVAVVCFALYAIFGVGHLLFPILVTLGYVIGRAVQLTRNHDRVTAR